MEQPGNKRQTFEITFLPDDRSIEVAEDESLLSAARSLGIPLVADCGGAGVCGRCRLKRVEGTIRTEGSPHLSRKEQEQGIIQACTSYPTSNLIVEVPASSIPEGIRRSEKLLRKILRAELPYTPNPMVEKYYVEIPILEDDDNLNVLDRLYCALTSKTGIRKFELSFRLLHRLPEIFKKSQWQVTAAIDRERDPAVILAVESGNTAHDNFGIVIDIGTTTIEGIMVDVTTGAVLHVVSQLNPQIKYGADVTARLQFASRGKGLLILNDIINDRINEIIMELIHATGVNKENIYSVVISANTAMIHFFLGFDTELLRKFPHIPFALSYPVFRAGEINIFTNPEARVFIVPGVGGYVGGDLVSSLVATGMPDEDFLLADIGTNGEVAVVTGGNVVCAATSAGPAFEGGGIKNGMRATSGAVNRIFYSSTGNDFMLETIDNESPRGITGTGLVDLLAELLLHGFVDKRGAFKNRAKTNRIKSLDDSDEFILVPEGEGQEKLSVTEQDLDYLIKSKGALYTGFDYLLKVTGKTELDMQRFFIAGALGGMINVENGVIIGLFPDIPRECFHFLGNGSLLGGWMMLLSREARSKAHDIASGAAYVELSTETGYMNEYTSALFLPHTELSRFPSVVTRLEGVQ